MIDKKAVIYVVGAILVALILVGGFKHRYSINDKISVTGLGEKEFVSDLIVWEGKLSVSSASLAEGYQRLEKDKKQVQEYLAKKGIKNEEIVFSFVSNYENREPIYNNGNYVGERKNGYLLEQTIKIESTEVDKVETLSRDITELMINGVNIDSQMPQYFYTKLDELKLEIIEMATKDAYSRAESIAEEAHSKIGKLASARMGVFQIVATNSSEAYTWGGAYNTSSKNKKANITMRLDYHIK